MVGRNDLYSSKNNQKVKKKTLIIIYIFSDIASSMVNITYEVLPPLVLIQLVKKKKNGQKEIIVSFVIHTNIKDPFSSQSLPDGSFQQDN